MYQLDWKTCTAIDILERSMTCHPSMFIEALESSAAEDLRYKAGKTGQVESAIAFRYAATQLAIKICQNGKAQDFSNAMGAGIIALSIACKLQLIPPYVRTRVAVDQWSDM